MKYQKIFTEKITVIENEFDVNSLMCDGVNIWPLIRIELVGVIRNSNSYKAPEISSIEGLSNKHHNNTKIFEELLNTLDSDAKADVILFSDEYLNSSIKIDGKYYNRFIDSFYELFKNDYKVKIINIKDSRKPFVNDEAKIDITFVKELVRIDSLLSYANKIYQVDHLDELVRYLAKKNIYVDSEYLLYQINYLMVSAKHMAALLQRVSTKSIFLICYYIPFNMGLILASKRLGIKSVELQHGAQHDYHHAYTHMNKIPPSGYELLPKHYWMWGDVSKNRLDIWADKTDYHEIIIGGNSFLNFYKSSLRNKSSEAQIFYPKDKINILVSLQVEKFYSDEITKAIEKSSENIIWHFKSHPVHAPDLHLTIKQKLKSLERVEYMFTNSVSLYDIMKYVDINITYSSSTAHELKSMEKVPSIFVRDSASYRAENGFFYCKTADEIVQTIKHIEENSLEMKKVISDEKYIEIDKSISYKAIERILQ